MSLAPQQKLGGFIVQTVPGHDCKPNEDPAVAARGPFTEGTVIQCWHCGRDWTWREGGWR